MDSFQANCLLRLCVCVPVLVLMVPPASWGGGGCLNMLLEHKIVQNLDIRVSVL